MENASGDIDFSLVVHGLQPLVDKAFTCIAIDIQATRAAVTADLGGADFNLECRHALLPVVLDACLGTFEPFIVRLREIVSVAEKGS